MRKLSEPQECICDGCGKTAIGASFLGCYALSPPAGWFVHGKVALDATVGPVEQWLYCSEACAAKIDESTMALAELAAMKRDAC